MKIRFLIGTFLGAIACLSPSALAFQKPALPTLPNYDKRAETAAPDANQQREADLLNARLPGVKIDRDRLLGGTRLISTPRRFLTGPNGKGQTIAEAAMSAFPVNDPHRVIKAFVNEHAALFGHNADALAAARVTRDYVTDHNGLRTVVWQQTLHDISVFEAVFMSHVTRNGELVSVASHFVSDPEKAAAAANPQHQALIAQPVISSAQALVLAARNLGTEVAVDSVTIIEHPEGPEKNQKLSAAQVVGTADVELSWLPMNRDSVRLCWLVELTTRARPELYSLLVDIETGEIMVRHCLTEYIQPASYNVFTSDSPSPFTPGLTSPSAFQPPTVARKLLAITALNTNASPNGWINDGDMETLGNNVDAHTDRDGDNQADLPRPQATGTNRLFNFPLNLSQSPPTYSDAAVVNLFYWNNFMHDKLYELGFTEAAGNFQATNFNRGGRGRDAVLADAQDGSGFNNANFSAPRDGTPGRMQMFLFDGPSPDRDGDLDAEVMCHEYTHGLSGRLVGGGTGISALQTRGMGEGWSDFYALSLLSEASDDVHGAYPSGGYVTFRLSGLLQNYYFGIRRYPYSTDLTKNPLTFKDIDPSQADPHIGVPISPIFGGIPADEVHNQGEVWCVTLWEARAALIDKVGFDEGNRNILRLVTDGMKLAPRNPTFLEARDAIIRADQINSGGDHYSDLWIAFAKRGMGYSASAPSSSSTAGVVEAFDLPPDVIVSVPDGILEVKVIPVAGSALFAGLPQSIFVRVTDGGPVTNATISATVNDVPLAFRNDGVAPDITKNNSIYSALFNVPSNISSATLTLVISAPDKETSTNVVAYTVIRPPANDSFSNSVKIASSGGFFISNNKLATLEPDEPVHAGIGTVAASLWWNFTPATNGPVLVDTSGSSFNSIVAVYTNTTLASLGEVVSADDVNGRRQALVQFNAKVGVTYRIAVAGFSTNDTGTIYLNVEPGGTPDFGAPVVTVSSPLSGLTVGTNRVLLTGSAIDPEPSPSGIKEILIRVNPGTENDGDDGSTSSLITSTNWSSVVGLSEGLNNIQVTATDVAGNLSEPVSLQVTYRRIDPVNDLFVNAIVLTNQAGVSTVNTLRATKESGEPFHAGNAGGKSVWWKFTPSDNGVLFLSTTNTTFDTLLGLYLGDHVDTLATVTSNDDAFPGSGYSELITAVQMGQTYRIAVDGFDGSAGAVFLSYTFTPGAVFKVDVSSTVGGSVTPSSGFYPSNATVQFTAVSQSNYQFTRWQGSINSTLDPLLVTVVSNLSITAIFTPHLFTDDFETGNLTKLPWTSSSNTRWLVQTNEVDPVFGGRFAARSGSISHSQFSSLILTTNLTAGAASFRYRVSSEKNWDKLQFFLNGVKQREWFGDIPWSRYQFIVAGGPTTLEWRYLKDASISIGLDAAFIDNVDLPTAQETTSSSAALLSVNQAGQVFRLHFIGQPNQQPYVIQGSTDLIEWQPLLTNMAINGVIEFSEAMVLPRRFYRVLLP